MQTSGPNFLDKRFEDISLCGLLLLEAAPPSTQHSIRDVSHDLLSMTADLLSTGAVEKGHTDPSLQDPFTVGMETKASRGD